MMLVYLVIFVYIFMLFLPLLGGMVSYRKNKNEPILINQTKIKDPRYFAKSFTRSFMDKWSTYDNSGKIKISKSEELDLADLVDKFEGEYNNILASEFYDFIPQGRAEFNKEIMVMQNAYIYGDIQVRAVKCMKDMIIGQGIKVLRWIDAEGYLLIRDNTDAGLSASSASVLSVGKSVRFKRLFAPVINIAMPKAYDINPTKDVYGLIPSNEVRRDIDPLGEFDVDEGNIAEFSIVSNRVITIMENVIVQGHLRSNKGVKLLDGSTVCGNIFANEDIYIGQSVTVLGNIFTHGNIYLSDDVEIGQPHRISSIVASGTIDFGLNTRVFGYIHSEKGGTVFNEDLSDMEVEDSIAQEIKAYSIHPDEKVKYLPHQAQDYHNAFPLTFRNNLKIKEIIVPEGVEVIRRSMFYGCTELERIVLPASLRGIEAFAFYGCTNLKVIEFVDSNQLQHIGESAFEQCRSLEEFVLPKQVEVLKTSTFSECVMLKDIQFSKDSQLHTLESHVFSQCAQLKSFTCPDVLTSIGMSAFLGCHELSLFKASPVLKRIDDYAFAQCSNLDHALLEAHVQKLINQTTLELQWGDA